MTGVTSEGTVKQTADSRAGAHMGELTMTRLTDPQERVLRQLAITPRAVGSNITNDHGYVSTVAAERLVDEGFATSEESATGATVYRISQDGMDWLWARQCAPLSETA